LQARAIAHRILQNTRKSVDVAAREDELWRDGSNKIVRSADTITHHDGTRTTHGFIDDYRERFVVRR
jgi:hypothetical protein